MSLATVKTGHARSRFGSVLSRVQYGGERIVLLQYGKPVAVIVPVEDFEAWTGEPCTKRAKPTNENI